MRTQTHTEGRPCEDTGRTQPFTSQGGRPQNEINPADILILDFQPLNCRETNFCCLSPPVRGIYYSSPN